MNIKDKAGHPDFLINRLKKRLDIRELIFWQKLKTSIKKPFPVRTNLPWCKGKAGDGFISTGSPIGIRPTPLTNRKKSVNGVGLIIMGLLVNP